MGVKINATGELKLIDSPHQGETKMKRLGCPLGKLLLEVTSPKV